MYVTVQQDFLMTMYKTHTFFYTTTTIIVMVIIIMTSF